MNEQQANFVKLRSLIRRAKQFASCKDCDSKNQLTFDHVPGRGIKLFNIGDIWKNSVVTEEQLIIEIKKCDIVCDKCHLIRTTNRKVSTVNAMRNIFDILSILSRN